MNVFTDLSQLKNINSPVVTIGMFDGVHKGHQKIIDALKLAAKECEGTSVIITFFEHPQTVLQNNYTDFRSITLYHERLKKLQEYGVENVCFLHFTQELSQLSAKEFVESFFQQGIQLKCLLLGYDNHFGNKAKGHFEQIYDLAEQYQFSIKKVDFVQQGETIVSSTKIRKALQEGNIALANDLLGYPYAFSGTVVHGNAVGRTLGFPTANIKVDNPLKMIPAIGIYAVKVVLEKQAYRGMMSIGIRPTFGLSELVIEVNILDFDQNIYDKEIEVQIAARMRDELKFKSVEELVAQLYKDKEQARHILSI